MYFSQFVSMLERDTEEKALAFDFGARNRRPPADPVNALPSFLPMRCWYAPGVSPPRERPPRRAHPPVPFMLPRVVHSVQS